MKFKKEVKLNGEKGTLYLDKFRDQWELYFHNGKDIMIRFNVDHMDIDDDKYLEDEIFLDIYAHDGTIAWLLQNNVIEPRGVMQIDGKMIPIGGLKLINFVED